ncbi:MAG: hypothetical protein AB2707_02460, partial [Candidatus Thiodiazotropha sp.]
MPHVRGKKTSYLHSPQTPAVALDRACAFQPAYPLSGLLIRLLVTASHARQPIDPYRVLITFSAITVPIHALPGLKNIFPLIQQVEYLYALAAGTGKGFRGRQSLDYPSAIRQGFGALRNGERGLHGNLTQRT